MRRVIFNQKGGVGKSTITCNLAAISAIEGKRTLVIDLDIQGNTTQYLLGERVDDADQTLARFFKECLSLGIFGKGQNSGLENIIHKSPFPNLYVMPSHPELEPLQSRLESRYKIFKLREALDHLEGYDAIYIDTPPVLNFYSQSALIAADKCLLPGSPVYTDAGRWRSQGGPQCEPGNRRHHRQPVSEPGQSAPANRRRTGGRGAPGAEKPHFTLGQSPGIPQRVETFGVFRPEPQTR